VRALFGEGAEPSSRAASPPQDGRKAGYEFAYPICFSCARVGPRAPLSGQRALVQGLDLRCALSMQGTTLSSWPWCWQSRFLGSGW